ncbi:MAG TPA: PIN domain-containing protein, partial [Candidatus Ozemobacteraceae bacterium]|nr:PIN domain-containing protein [Candidatus Ozemobacteraceae bacterium]
MRAYIDTDILIWHLRGEEKATKFLKKVSRSSEYELWVGAIQRAEIVFFMRPKEEAATELFLSQFRTAPIDQKIVDTAGEYFRKWHPSHGLEINDALLAATAAETGGHIFTL